MHHNDDAQFSIRKHKNKQGLIKNFEYVHYNLQKNNNPTNTL